MKLSAKDLAQITGGKVSGDGTLSFSGIMTDSRASGAGPDMLFIALRGLNHNGHRFIEPLYRRGVRLFMADTLPGDMSGMKDAAFVKVSDTLEAMQKLAGWCRGNFGGRVIAVTGSAGKTIVKEWLAGVMSNQLRVIRSPKSYNSQVGVALSLMNVDDRYETAVIEAGVSRPGEMERLQKIIRPDVVIITNIGDAHGENFNGRKSIATEKLRLAEGARLVICSADDELIMDQVAARYPSATIFNWSVLNNPASLMIDRLTADNGSQRLRCKTADHTFEVVIPFADRASAENAISVIACCLAEKIPEEVIIRAMASLPAVAMRMEVKEGINGCTLIEDYYNSDPASLNMALDFLRNHSRGRTALILSDFRQIGGDEKRIYMSVADAVSKMKIDHFTGIGEALMRQKDCFPAGSQFYNTTQEFADSFRGSFYHDETILIKGARVFGFERISSLLVRQLHQTRLEINMNAVAHNFNEFRRLLNPGTDIMVMVKAFAYGAGSAEIASLLEYNHAGYFAVAYADEGAALREAGITTPVMVMNPEENAMELIIRNNLEPVIYSTGSCRAFLNIARRYGLLHYPVHIKIDTGMHRLGFDISDIGELASMLQERQNLRVISLFSHLAASENEQYDYFSHRQAEKLISAASKLKELIGYGFKLHLLNSSGICRFPEYQFDMVRLGIGLYGIGHYAGMSLRKTGRFVTSVSQVRKVASGEPVGYGCLDAADHERDIAVIPVGYADGLRHELGNGKGGIWLKGRKVPVTGNICMDMCMVDVTGLNVQPGEEAEIFGNNITVEELAAQCNTIPYEILTSIPPRVKRVYVNE